MILKKYYIITVIGLNWNGRSKKNLKPVNSTGKFGRKGEGVSGRFKKTPSFE